MVLARTTPAYPQIMFSAKILKISIFFSVEIYIFFQLIKSQFKMHGRVFIMYCTHLILNTDMLQCC